jgi:hypothetical protein
MNITGVCSAATNFGPKNVIAKNHDAKQNHLLENISGHFVAENAILSILKHSHIKRKRE